MKNLKKALIGYSGFIGSNLIRETNFENFYRSNNIFDISREKFGQIICAGVSAVKWLANKEPEADWASIQRLISALEQTEAEQFVLISTIDVYPVPTGVDEATEISPDEVTQAYGRHRLGPVPIAMTTRCLIQGSQEGLDHGGVVLAERGAMGSDRAVAAAFGR